MSSRRIVLATLFALLGFGIVSAVLHHGHDGLILGVLTGAVLAAIAVAIGTGALDVPGRRHVIAAPEEERVAGGAQHPFRGAAPPPLVPRRLSARLVATVLLVGLVATALGVPFLLHRARWIEIEAVLVGWWSIWVLLLALIAYRGVETRDDWTFAVSLPWRPTVDAPEGAWKKRGIIADILGAASDLDAVLVALAASIVAALAFAGAWIILEMLVPALFFVAYVALLAALRRIRGYEGSVRAVGAAALWATAYVGPLATVVWLVHVFATT